MFLALLTLSFSLSLFLQQTLLTLLFKKFVVLQIQQNKYRDVVGYKLQKKMLCSFGIFTGEVDNYCTVQRLTRPKGEWMVSREHDSHQISTTYAVDFLFDSFVSKLFEKQQKKKSHNQGITNLLVSFIIDMHIYALIMKTIT